MHLDNHHDQHHRQHHYDNQRDDIDYESLYTQDGDHTHHDERNYNDRHYQDNYDSNDDYRHNNHDHQNDNHDYHDSNFDKTTNLYKELTDSNIDQDVLFKTLMLYIVKTTKVFTIDITDHLNIVMMTSLETNIKKEETRYVKTT